MVIALQMTLMVFTITCGLSATILSETMKNEKSQAVAVLVGAFFASFICLLASAILL